VPTIQLKQPTKNYEHNVAPTLQIKGVSSGQHWHDTHTYDYIQSFPQIIISVGVVFGVCVGVSYGFVGSKILDS